MRLQGIYSYTQLPVTRARQKEGLESKIAPKRKVIMKGFVSVANVVACVQHTDVLAIDLPRQRPPHVRQERKTIQLLTKK